MSVEDIGKCCAGYLLNRDGTSKPGVRSVDLHGPRSYSSRDVHQAIEKVTGKKWELVNISKGELAESFGKKVPEKYVQDFVEMITAVLPGGVLAGDLEGGKDTVRGTVELEDALRRMVSEQ